jgi:tetratricopeptide (TPR) repeat protein
LEISRALGARRLVAYDLMNLTELYLNTGDLLRANQSANQALHEITQVQDAKGTLFTLCLVGLTLLEMGDTPGAIRRFQEARQMLSGARQEALLCQVNVALAAAYVQAGQLEAAQSLAGEAWAYLKPHGWVGMSLPGWTYLTLAETFDALGDELRYREAVEAGYQTVLAVAETIDVPAWRQTFLEEVPAHRKILELWERVVVTEDPAPAARDKLADR